MPFKTIKRSATVAKVALFDNIVLGRWTFLSAVLYNLYAIPLASAEITTIISWPQTDDRRTGYVLEVSDDAKFGTSLHRADVTGSKFIWQAPKEGVYHWRVTPLSRMRPNDSAGMVETSSFASGSFAALGPRSESNAEATLQWTPALGVAAYYLREQSNGTPGGVSVALKASHVLQRKDVSFVVEVVPRNPPSSYQRSKDAANYFDPGLRIVPKDGAPPAVAVSARELVVGQDLPPVEQEPQLIQPLPPAPPAIKLDDTPHEDEGFPDYRISEILVAVYGGEERTFATKGPMLERRSRGSMSGGRIALRASPVVGLHLMGEADGHGREAKWRDMNGNDAGSQLLSTYLGQIGLGFDTFFRNPNRRHQLVVEVRGALGRVAGIPVEQAAMPTDSSLSLKMYDVQLAGGGLWYRWTANRWGAGAHGVILVQATDRSEENDATAQEFGVFFAADVVKYVTIQTGVRSRQITLSRCADEEIHCSAEGVSKARMSHVSGYVGLGYVMY